MAEPDSELCERLAYLEAEAARLDPRKADRDRLTGDVVAHATAFLDEIDHAPAFSEPPDDIQTLSDADFPEDARGTAEVLETLRTYVDSTGAGVTSPNYFAYIPPGGLYYAALADYLAAVANRYVGWSFINPGAVRVEHKVVRWLARAIGRASCRERV